MNQNFCQWGPGPVLVKSILGVSAVLRIAICGLISIAWTMTDDWMSVEPGFRWEFQRWRSEEAGFEIQSHLVWLVWRSTQNWYLIIKNNIQTYHTATWIYGSLQSSSGCVALTFELPVLLRQSSSLPSTEHPRPLLPLLSLSCFFEHQQDLSSKTHFSKERKRSLENANCVLRLLFLKLCHAFSNPRLPQPKFQWNLFLQIGLLIFNDVSLWILK